MESDAATDSDPATESDTATESDAATDSGPPAHLRWTWEDVLEEAQGRDGIGVETDWTASIARDVPDGSKWHVIANGNIALVSARMKHDLGFVDWDLLKREYDRHYSSSDQSNGGTIFEWIDGWRRRTHDGADIIPCSPGLTMEMVERCRRHAHEVVSSITGRIRRPREEDLFHVLLVMFRIAGRRRVFEASEDFISRRAGLNPFATWEEQAAAEPDEEGHVRQHRRSVAARKRLVTLMRLICDMTPGVETGKPIGRRSIGSNGTDTLLEHGRARGSVYEIRITDP